MYDYNRIRYLLRNHLFNRNTPEEEAEFNGILADAVYDDTLKELLDTFWKDMELYPATRLSRKKADHLLHQMLIARTTKTHRSRWFKIAAAIVLVALLAPFVYQKTKLQAPIADYFAQTDTLDIRPGGTKALLTLDNRAPILLRPQTGGIMLNDSSFRYTDSTVVPIAKSTKFLRLITPEGGEYQVILPDGTHVMLNAASTLVYANDFNNRSRTVELEGEAYFEVAPAKDRPFLVKTRTQTVEVLGTAFNITAYREDASITTSVAEGRVRISQTNAPNGKTAPVILHAGQQAQTVSDEEAIMLSKADLTETLAWKEGLFVFNNENLSSIMKRLSRWYAIDVVYSGEVPDIRFLGNYSRKKTIKDLLENIALTGKIRFTIDDQGNNGKRRVIVTSNP